jgi:lipopolysaccharide export system permease protein
VSTFDRHLLKEWLTVLCLIMVAACGVMFVQVCFDDFRTLREAGARGADFWRYALVTMPSFLSITLPLCLLLSVQWVLTKLRGSNELTAMRAAGASFTRITAPLWIIGVLCCGLASWLSSTVVPWSVQASRAQKEEFEFRKEAKTQSPDQIGAVYSVAFDNSPDHRMWFFNRYSEYTNRGYGVSVSELDYQRRETTRWLAAEAWQDPSGRGWVFRNGREMHFDPETGEIVSSVPFAEKRIARFREDPRLMLLIDRRPIDLSFFELGRLTSYFGQIKSPKITPYAIRYNSLLADVIAPLIVIAIAIPFSITGVRVNPAVGISKSIGLFFLYMVLQNLGQLLATKGWIDPIDAAWLPNLSLALLALWFFIRVR